VCSHLKRGHDAVDCWHSQSASSTQPYLVEQYSVNHAAMAATTAAAKAAAEAAMATAKRLAEAASAAEAAAAACERSENGRKKILKSEN